MRLELERDVDGRVVGIRGFCAMPGDAFEDQVISFTKRNGVWKTTSSVCFPVDIEKAKVVYEVYCMAFLRLQEVSDESDDHLA